MVENVERNLEERHDAARGRPQLDGRGRRALIAIVLVLCAVFVPTLFISGLSGAFYQQFAITISAATVISLLLSLDPRLPWRRSCCAARAGASDTACGPARTGSSRLPAIASTPPSSA